MGKQDTIFTEEQAEEMSWAMLFKMMKQLWPVGSLGSLHFLQERENSISRDILRNVHNRVPLLSCKDTHGRQRIDPIHQESVVFRHRMGHAIRQRETIFKSHEFTPSKRDCATNKTRWQADATDRNL